MGTWEVGLYQNDVSADVRDEYIAKLKAGKSDEEALQEMLCEYKEESEDDDDKYDFYLALADTMWKKGRLTEEIKTKALEILEEDKISERWLSEKIRKERVKVLEKVKEKLTSPMPERKKVPIHKPYKLGWKEGEVYCFQITGCIEKYVKGYEQYIGWYALFYVERIYTEDWQVKGIQDELAELFFYLRKEKPKDSSDIYDAKNICFQKGNGTNKYKVYIVEASRKERPKDLTCLGKISDFMYPANCSSVAMCFTWGRYLYERDILKGYCTQLEYERQNQQ